MKIVSKCGLGACPTVVDTGSDTYIVIGKHLDVDKLPPAVREKVGEGETAVEIPKRLIDDMQQTEQ